MPSKRGLTDQPEATRGGVIVPNDRTKYECAFRHIACTVRSGMMMLNRKDGTVRIPLQITAAAAIVAAATTAQAQMRFQGMDANRDGVITRAEWRGNDTSFRNQDWNQDG